MNRQHATKGLKVIGILFLAHALLSATHEGEFWPFSIFPMFSQAGNPWARAMVLDVSELEDSNMWSEREYPLPSDEAVVSLRALGIDQIDYSNFVVRTTEWTESRQRSLHSMFGSEALRDNQWMIVIVRGALSGDNKVESSIEPILLLTEDEIRLKNSEQPIQLF